LVYKIEYKSSVSRDIKQIDKNAVDRILSEIKDTLSTNPIAGEILRGEFTGLYKLRIGEYRVIYSIIGKESVLVLRIRHRSKAYG
jgi:mRNA interferase RelE/StbE